jgi:glycosyltransferase involved in cell wall biosynthesis
MLPEGSRITLLTQEPDPNRHFESPEPWLELHRLNYTGFGFRSAAGWMRDLPKLRRYISEKNISTIHCWCTPAGMMGYILSRLSGKRLVIDSFEPHAEAMIENGEWQRGGLAFRILSYFEKKQAVHAAYLIACARGMKEYTMKKFGVDRADMLFKPACVDLDKFQPVQNNLLRRELGLEIKIVCVYAGKLGGIYLKEEVFDFFRAAASYWQNNFHVILLSAASDEEIQDLGERAGLPEGTIIRRFVPHAEVPQWLAVADFAITPVRPVPSKKCCSPVKDGEYWASGLPVAITAGISDDSTIIAENKIGSILEPLTTARFSEAVKEIDALLKDPQTRERSREAAVKYRNFSIAEEVYSKIYKKNDAD